MDKCRLRSIITLVLIAVVLIAMVLITGAYIDEEPAGAICSDKVTETR
ncbi:hypothetical protein ES705_36547 [subsurface metagenome]